ncbi:GL13536 [Drosophila persimilis]|uniref:Alkaline phosphatase n=2 Tax=pseudoobscura subgroup TaxID=32358 RepID=A0A6I8UM32_DROPS|nr:alkaline phosphatase 4 [Drosophila pseudoobscura]XP_002020395.1 alkaline phosphatase 4 [Drosophila persimilis]EDW39207.1 GL13536 [Drosophila persimilis]
MHCLQFVAFVVWCGGLIPGSWTATLQPPPLIQTLSAGSDIGPEFNLDAQQQPPLEKLEPEDAEFWRSVGLKQLEKTIEQAKRAEEHSYAKKARNIIIFIGDGMGVSTISAGRIYKGQYLKHGHGEEETLSFDNFPNTGMAKTYNVDKQVPDSAGTATALFTGIKTHYGAIGVDATRSKVDAKLGRIETIMEWAQKEGKRTGIVTTTRITHATPAATYAHIYDRDWECETEVPAESVGIHVDIARQLVENAPGNRFNVILGGGMSPMGILNATEVKRTKFEGPTETICSRRDQRNLPAEWLAHHSMDKVPAALVHNRDDLLAVDAKNVDHLMGLFRNNHITYSIAREVGEPSLQEMTETALRVLERGDDSPGFVLLVEGGRIDQGHHMNYARAALHEVYEFDLAIQAALNMTDSDETLIVVTADHSHAVTFNGYALRGNDILGASNLHEKADPMVYETISYANGPGYYDHLANESRPANSSNMWMPLKLYTEEERQAPTYRHLASVPRKDETHGGEDVAVFASGPGSSLVRGVFEQNYVAYVMSYAGCIGPAKDFDDSCEDREENKPINSSSSGSADNVLRAAILPILAAASAAFLRGRQL